jgi:hypothetical protein
VNKEDERRHHEILEMIESDILFLKKALEEEDEETVEQVANQLKCAASDLWMAV